MTDRPSFTITEQSVPSADVGDRKAGLLSPHPSASLQEGRQRVESTPQISATTLTINLVTATLGTGILTLPWATAGASLVLGAVITTLVMALNVWTNTILVRAAHRVKVYDIGGLLGKLPGRWNRIARAVCDLSIWISVGLCLIGYLIVVADSLELLLPGVSRGFRVLAGGIVALPLSFLDQQRLAFSSSFSIAANIYLFGLLLLSPAGQESDSGVTEERCLFGVGHGSITMISALMQAAIVQMCVLPMYEQLERRSPKRFLGCATTAFGFVTVLFVVFSSVGYLLYGPRVSSNILQDLPKGIGGDVARVAMAVAVLGVFPIMLSSMIAPLRHAEQRAARKNRAVAFPSPPRSPTSSPMISPPQSPSGSQSTIMYQSPPPGYLEPQLILPKHLVIKKDRSGNSSIGTVDSSTALTEDPEKAGKLRACLRSFRWSDVATVGVVCSSVLGAILTKDLGSVNIINGAMQVSVLIGVVPFLVGWFLVGRRGGLWRIAMCMLLGFGIVASVLGISYTSNGADELLDQCSWRVAWK